MRRIRLLTVLLCIWFSYPSFTQNNTYNFHHVTVKDGLHDGIVKCVGQDKYGYIWIGTVGGLNRFDGKNIQQFTYSFSDTLSPYSSQPSSILSDKQDRLWVGFQNGLMKFDFEKNGFIKIPPITNVHITRMIQYDDTTLFLASSKGLIQYNIKGNTAVFFADSKDSAHRQYLSESFIGLTAVKNYIYLACRSGLMRYDVVKDNAEKIRVPSEIVGSLRHIAIDKSGNVWLGTQSESKIYKLSPDFKKVKVYDETISTGASSQNYNVSGILCDNKNKIWVVTGFDGLLEYDETTDTFIKHLHDEKIPSSPLGNSYRSIFQSNNGLIWLGDDVNGLNYFNPVKNIFQPIFPFEDHLDIGQRKVGRAFAEDKNGNYWMGTHEGVTRFNTKTGIYTYWKNEGNKQNIVYQNVIRCLYCDDENNVWIATSSGVNRFNNKTQCMEFIRANLLPNSFYNTITEDRSGNIWFGTNDTSGLYWFNTIDKTFQNISAHPVLKKYHKLAPVSYVMEDSKHRLWISFARKGLVMYDKQTGKTKQYQQSEKNEPGILGNQVIDIKEDKKGVIWLTTFNGINGIDVEHNTILSFNNKNGLIGNMVSPLAIDSLNRIWIGVTGGLMMLNDARNHFTLFTESDGLPSIEFPEHAAVELKEGNVIFPSNNGFIKFNPSHYVEQQNGFPFYIRSYSIFDKDYYSIKQTDSPTILNFKPNQNSFAFNLVALNYLNPAQTWFAYKLDGFEKDWHYTQETKAVYTNVPGGQYEFLLKASNSNTAWDHIAPKKIEINVQTPFYKHPLFGVFLLLLFLVILYIIYTYRLHQQQQLFQLKEKAQLLEKEKALVMYEGLKQQLNPHFLFNSLASLNSLINREPKAASLYLRGLSRTYRYILKSRDTETVSLKDEILFAKDYIQLQQTRFEKGFAVKVDIDEAYHHRKIVPVTLQNLIENAIKHNIIDDEFPLLIQLFIEDDYLVVKNNLQKKEYVESSNKQGLHNLIKLYKYLSPNPIVILETAQNFIIKIPLL